MVERTVRKAWARLEFGEWLRAVMSVPCISCGAPVMEQCTDKANANCNPHEWRHLQAQKEWEHLRAQEIDGVDTQEMLDAMEASRTCPWCGTLFDTVILMEGHEVGCE